MYLVDLQSSGRAQRALSASCPSSWLRVLLSGLLLVVALLSSTALPLSAAADFPPITDEQRAMTAVPFDAKADAVILFKIGEFHMQDFGKGMSDSRYEVQVRLKILTEEGKDYAEIALPHSNARRLVELEGRTVLPDGRELPLDATFRQRASENDPYFLTVGAFDGVEVGAILDYRYVLRYDSIFRLDPWYFQDRIPTQYSEIRYIVPSHIGFKPWARESIQGRLKYAVEQQVNQRRAAVASMSNMPSVPSEPLGYPFRDLSAAFLVLPTQYVDNGVPFDLMTSWEQVCELTRDYYDDMWKDRGSAKRKARDLVANLDTPRAKAEAVYRFVRDEIRFENLADPEAQVDDILAAGHGNSYDQTILLWAMLDAVDVEASLVWASYRNSGHPDMETPNPSWLEGRVVRVTLPDGEYFLDPIDRGLAFGQLQPTMEGMPALVYDTKDPEVIELPEQGAQTNRRHARLTLQLDAEGRVTGNGVVEFTGQHAWRHLFGGTSSEIQEHWDEWLHEAFEDYQVTAIEVDEQVDGQRVEVRFELAQLEEVVLGDEASLSLSRPLGPVEQPFKLEPANRRTPVQFTFADRDLIEVTMSWPDGWELDLTPPDHEFRNAAGEVNTKLSVDAAGRRLSFQRRFDLHRREFHGRDGYTAVRDLFGQMEEQDAKALVLVAQ